MSRKRNDNKLSNGKKEKEKKKRNNVSVPLKFHHIKIQQMTTASIINKK